ncbi:unnamed protein product [Lota lota]
MRLNWQLGSKNKEAYLQPLQSSEHIPYILELNYLRENHSDVIKATKEAEMALKLEVSKHDVIKQQAEKQKGLNDGLQSQIERARAEKNKLLTDKLRMVSISVGSHGGRPGKAAVWSLIVLALVLFAVDVSLGIYYSQQTVMPQSSEGFQTILEKYRSTREARNKAIQQLEKERRQIEVTRWEMEHQKRRGRDYVTLVDATHKENAALQSQVALMTVDCGHCLPGWIHIDSNCFYLSGPTLAKRSWQEARNNCKRKGADLAIIDSSGKQVVKLKVHIPT